MKHNLRVENRVTEFPDWPNKNLWVQYSQI